LPGESLATGREGSHSLLVGEKVGRSGEGAVPGGTGKQFRVAECKKKKKKGNEG